MTKMNNDQSPVAWSTSWSGCSVGYILEQWEAGSGRWEAGCLLGAAGGGASLQSGGRWEVECLLA